MVKKVSVAQMEKEESQLKEFRAEQQRHKEVMECILLKLDSLPVTSPPTVVKDETIPPPQQMPSNTDQSSTLYAFYAARKGELPIFR